MIANHVRFLFKKGNYKLIGISEFNKFFKIQINDFVIIGSTLCKIKNIKDDKGAFLSVANPSFAVELLGKIKVLIFFTHYLLNISIFRLNLIHIPNILNIL